MKLAKAQEQTNTLSKRWLIPSIIAIGIIPLITHEHEYKTHLEDQMWFAYQTTDIDFFLFFKQWAAVALACVCLILLLIRVKYYYETLPWSWKKASPALIYMAFVLISAIFSIRPIFAFAGGYSMLHGAPALLSYMVILYYTYTCIVSEDHVLYLLRWSSLFIGIEIVLCFSEVLGAQPLNTTVGKILISNPARWSHLDTIGTAATVAGTLYNPDYLSMYMPVVVPLLLALAWLEKEKWRKIVSLALAIMAVASQYKASTSGLLGMIGAAVIVALVLASRDRKKFTITAAIVAIIVVASVLSIIYIPPIHERVQMQFGHQEGKDDSDVPIKQIKTGSSKKGITIQMKDGRTIHVKFFLGTDMKLDINATDKDGNDLTLTCIDDSQQEYVFTDQAYQDMFFIRDDSMGVSTVDLVLKDDALKPLTDENGNLVETVTDSTTTSDDESQGEAVTDPIADAAHEKFGETEGYCAYPFTNSLSINGKEINDYYFVTWAGKAVPLPQKNIGEVYEVFPNTFWSGRGYIFNRTLPLLKKYIFKGAGADNFIMAFPQSFYIRDNYIEGKYNSIDVKPHSYYLQLWVQEGFIAFAAVMIFIFVYLIRSIILYRKVSKEDRIGILGFSVFIAITAYMISVIAIDSNSCTAPVFWTILGLGLGINKMAENRPSD